MKKNTKELIRLIDLIPDDNATPEDVKILKSGYKNLIILLERLFPYEIHNKETGR
nr:MAG TPA: hypothetical protein [Caudoviricetes sp.]